MKSFLPKLISTFIFILGLCNLLHAQEVSFTGEFNHTSLKKALLEIESQSHVYFYYKEEWIDSLYADGSFSNTPLKEVLTSLFTDHSLSFHSEGNSIFVTYQTIIIGNPAISNYEKKESSTDVNKGLVFSREYQSESTKDVESVVFEIGSRNKANVSGSSSIVGYVKDEETGSPIEGALVYSQNPFTSATTDQDGFYNLTLSNGKHQILFQFYGMKPTQRNIVLFSDGNLNVDMSVDIIALQEVTVESDRDVNVASVQMGVSKINVEEVKTVPVVLGEKDILKIATTKAGVQTIGEGASGYNIRGGKADQNLILLNGAPIYNSSHFFGFFSVFNPEAIENMELFKSGIPARFGGRLSSVFEIESKKASTNKFAGEGGISPITGKLTLEIPIVKEKSSLLIGGRTTYSNWLLKRVKNAGFKDNDVRFLDLIGRYDHQINDKNSLTISSYYSYDKFRLSSDTLFSFSDFSFENFNTSISWNSQIKPNLDFKASTIFASYGYSLNYDESAANAFTQDFGIKEGSLNGDFNWYRNDKEKVNFGVSVKNYHVNPGSKSPLGDSSTVAGMKLNEEKALETALYISDQYEVSKKILLYAGIRYVMFNAIGPQTVLTYASGLPKNSDNVIDTVNYKSGEIIKTYHGPEWRLSGRYTLTPISSLKASISRTRQYIHTLSNSASLSPTDTWRLSNYYLKPQTSDQFSLGYYHNILGKGIEVSAEGYYKLLQNLVDFKTGATFLLNERVEQEILQGRGKSYGFELSIEKSGKISGWLNYTYARTFIQLDSEHEEERINNGKYYPTSYDKPHTINFVGNFKVTRRLSLSLNTTYSTGRPVTIPVGLYETKNSQHIYYSDRNAYRIPDYFRMDLGINLEGNHKLKKLSHSFWSLSVYNVTGRDNPFSVFFNVQDGKVSGSQLVVFGSPIPTLSYNFKF